jgi:superfamily I DNA and RNA helicase
LDIQAQTATNGVQPIIIGSQDHPEMVGHQIDARKAMRPLMSYEQQQLVCLNMDGKPRLVRGVAGSGKTLVMANWLQQVVSKLSDDPQASIWAVYANKALEGMITTTIQEV